MRMRALLAALCCGGTLLVVGGGISLAYQHPGAADGAGAHAPASFEPVRSPADRAGFQPFTLRAPELEAAGEAFELALAIDGVPVVLRLQRVSVRGAHYGVQVQLPDGSLAAVPPGPVSTFRGPVEGIDGAVVAGAILSQGFEATIFLPDGSRRIVMPLRSYLPGAQPSDYVLLDGADSFAGGVCGTEIDAAGPPATELGGGDCGGLCMAQLAVDCDFEYFVSQGSSVSNTEARVNQVINQMNADPQLYNTSPINIRHDISAILVRTSEPDPYSSTSSGTLLSQFRTQWLTQHLDIERDVAILFTGKELAGSIIGQAFTIGGICTTSAYCVAQVECCGGTACAVDLVAHELGHLWSCTHVSDGSTMNPSIECATRFATDSVIQIVAHRNTRTCMVPPDPPHTFELLSPMDGATGVSLFSTLDWADSTSADTYELWLDDDPGFATPLVRIVDAAQRLTESGYTPPLSLTPGRQYYWKVVAYNGFGSLESTPSTASFVTLRDCNGNGIDDAAELQDPLHDCNGNGVLDDCDLSGAYQAASADMPGCFWPNTPGFTLADAPEAASTVTITVRARGDLNVSSEYIDILVNATPVAQAFLTNGQDCTLIQEVRVVSATAFNNARGGAADVTVTFAPSATVGNNCTTPFAGTWVFGQVEYLGVPTSTDKNHNDMLDECEAPEFPPGDMNCDGAVTVSDIGGFALAVTSWFSECTAYGQAYPDCRCLNGDVNGDGAVTVGDVGAFVALLAE